MALGTRPARPFRRGRSWLFFAVLATVLVLIINAALSARSPGPARQQAEQSYLDQALPAIQQSTEQGLDISNLLGQALTLSPSTLANHLNEDFSQAQQALASVEKLNPPAAMKTPHALLVSALDLRASGAKAMGQAVATALSNQPPTAAIGALASAGLDLEASDRAYALFQQAVPATGSAVPKSVWVPDTSIYTTPMLSVFVNSLRAHSSATPVVAVVVVTVTTNPAPVNVLNGVQILPVASTLSLQVVVANTGNQPEPNLTVMASIAPSQIGPTQSVRNFVGLNPGESRTVGLGPLRMIPGQATTLTATVTTSVATTATTVAGPSAGSNNSQVITLEMQ